MDGQINKQTKECYAWGRRPTAGGVKIADRSSVISNCRVSRESCIKSWRYFPGRVVTVLTSGCSGRTETVLSVCSEDQDHLRRLFGFGSCDHLLEAM